MDCLFQLLTLAVLLLCAAGVGTLIGSAVWHTQRAIGAAWRGLRR